MSPAMTALTSVGITHNMVILGILFIIVATVIGLYWHIILPGAIGVAVVCLFVGGEPAQDQVKVVKPAEVTAEVKPEVKEFDEHEAYMQDCVEVAQYSKKKCESLWAHREDDEKEEPSENTVQDVAFKPARGVKLLNVSNKEYIQRREAALKKPGAVIMQDTYH